MNNFKSFSLKPYMECSDVSPLLIKDLLLSSNFILYLLTFCHDTPIFYHFPVISKQGFLKQLYKSKFTIKIDSNVIKMGTIVTVGWWSQSLFGDHSFKIYIWYSVYRYVGIITYSMFLDTLSSKFFEFKLTNLH